MKRISYIIILVSLLSSCSSNKNIITMNKSDLSEKEQSLIENNSCYSTASIVGGGANLIQAEQEQMMKDKIRKREMKLKNIPGLTISNLESGFKAIAQNEILFQFDSHELNDNAKNILAELSNIIKEIPETHVKIVGHTDNIGEKEYNLVLSKNRASAVGNYLRQSGVDTNMIIEDGKGFSEPIADNKTKEGRARNRRVEIYINNN